MVTTRRNRRRTPYVEEILKTEPGELWGAYTPERYEPEPEVGDVDLEGFEEPSDSYMLSEYEAEPAPLLSDPFELEDIYYKPEQMLRGELRRAQELGIPKVFTAEEASMLGMEVAEPDWLVKFTPDLTKETGFSLSYLTPDQWEITEDERYISPEGEVFTQADLEEAQAGAVWRAETDLLVQEIFGGIPVPEMTGLAPGASKYELLTAPATVEGIVDYASRDAMGFLKLLSTQATREQAERLLEALGADEETLGSLDILMPAPIEDIQGAMKGVLQNYYGKPIDRPAQSDYISLRRLASKMSTGLKESMKDMPAEDARALFGHFLKDEAYFRDKRGVDVNDVINFLAPPDMGQEIELEGEDGEKITGMMAPNGDIFVDGRKVAIYDSATGEYSNIGYLHTSLFGLELEIPVVQKEIGTLEKAGLSFLAGVGDVLGMAGGTAKWLGRAPDDSEIGAGLNLETLYTLGEAMRAAAVGLQYPAASMATNPDLEHFQVGNLWQPEWWATRPMQSVPFALMTLPAGAIGWGAGVGIAGGAATRLALGKFSTTVLKTIGGGMGSVAVGSTLESGLEAGAAYNDARERGLSDSTANDIATDVFRKNMSMLAPANAAEFAVAFAPIRMGTSARLIRRGLVTAGKVSGKMAITGLSEAGQEYYQEIVQRQALGQDISPWALSQNLSDPEIQEIMVIGGLMGIAMAGAIDSFRALQGRTVDNMPAPMRSAFEAEVALFEAAGLTREQAELAALDKMVDKNPDAERVAELSTQQMVLDGWEQAIQPTDDVEAAGWAEHFEQQRGDIRAELDQLEVEAQERARKAERVEDVATAQAQKDILEIIEASDTPAERLQDIEAEIANMYQEFNLRAMPFHGRAPSLYPGMSGAELGARYRAFERFANDLRLAIGEGVLPEAELPAPVTEEIVTPEAIAPIEEPPAIAPEITARLSDSEVGALQAIVPKLRRVIAAAKPARIETELLKHEEKGKRVAAAERERERVFAMTGDIDLAMAASKKKLEGKYSKADFAIPEGAPTVQDYRLMKEAISESRYQYFERLNLIHALDVLLSGEIPQPAQIRHLDEAFPGMGEAINEMANRLEQELMDGGSFDDWDSSARQEARRQLSLSDDQGRQGPLFKQPETWSDHTKRAWKVFLEAINLPRSLLTIWDMSYPMRQAAPLAMGQYRQYLSAFRTMFEVAFSDENYKALNRSLKTRRWAWLAQQAELSHVELDAPISQREEGFMSAWVAKYVPGAKISQRAFVAFGNKFRADVFDYYAEQWQDANPPLSQYQELARFINNATGRGQLGPLEGSAPLLTATFFAPRLQVSRIAMPLALFSSSPEVRNIAAKNIVAFVGAGTMALAIAELAGADVEKDPRSTDFGKIRVGDTRLDFWGGYLPYTRLQVRLITGQRKTNAGVMVDVNRADTVQRFLRSKFAPGPGFIFDVLDGETFIGEEMSLESDNVIKQAYNRLSPLFMQDFIDAIHEDGVVGGLMAAPAFFGAGVVSYPDQLDEITDQLGEPLEDELGRYSTKNLWTDVNRSTKGLTYKDALDTGPERYNQYVLSILKARGPRDKFEESIAHLSEHERTERRREWLESHPEENAGLALWGQAKPVTREAYDRMWEMARELDIPADLLPEQIVPRSISDSYFDYVDAVREHKANSAEARLVRAENSELQTWGERLYGWEPVDTPVEALRIKVKYRVDFDAYDAIQHSDSKRQAALRQAYLGSHPAFARARREHDAWVEGVPEHLIDEYVTYYMLPNASKAGYRLNHPAFDQWLMREKGLEPVRGRTIGRAVSAEGIIRRMG